MPLAYSAPTTLPALVPATTAGARPLASSILITPTWAKPLAAPPPSAMPILMGAGGAVAVACGVIVGWLGVVLLHAASPARPMAASGRQTACRRMPENPAFIGAGSIGRVILGLVGNAVLVRRDQGKNGRFRLSGKR